MKPVVLPMLAPALAAHAQLACDSDRASTVRSEAGMYACSLRFTPSTRLNSCGKTLMKRDGHVLPVVENPFGAGAAGQLLVAQQRSLTIWISDSSSKGSRSTEARLQRFSVKSPRSSKT